MEDFNMKTLTDEQAKLLSEKMITEAVEIVDKTLLRLPAGMACESSRKLVELIVAASTLQITALIMNVMKQQEYDPEQGTGYTQRDIAVPREVE